MFNISSYLKRISNTLNQNVLDTKGVAEIIAKHTGIIKDTEFFEIKDGVMHTTLTPSEKMALFIKKEAILSDLASFSVKDII